MTAVSQKANARRLSGARANKLTNAAKVRRSPRNVNATYGPPELCAWEVESGVFWIQTTEPEFSRRLEKREDARRVEVSGINHFRRTFEIRGRWRKIRRIIDRFLVSAGGHFSQGLRPKNTSEKGGSVTVPASANGQNNAVLEAGGGQCLK
jgi:hypothetical protein